MTIASVAEVVVVVDDDNDARLLAELVVCRWERTPADLAAR